MLGILLILLFVVLVAFPGFYIITRRVFPHGRKRTAAWLAAGLTLLLVCILAALMAGSLR